MKITLRSEKSNTVTVIVLAILTVSLLFLSAYLGEFVMPFAAAVFALLLAFDNKKHIVSAICALVGVAFVFLPFQFNPIWSVVAVVCGGVLYLTYAFGFSKCDSAMLLTVVTSASMILFFFIVAFDMIGEWNFDSAIRFYLELKEMYKHEFVSSVVGIYSVMAESGELQIDAEYVSTLFDSFVNMLVSLIAIISFVLVGIMMKTFCAIARRVSVQDDTIHAWRFETNVVYSYFYFAIYIISIFVLPDTIIGITLANVVSILSFVFAYMGIKFALEFFADRGKRGLGKIVIVAAILIFNTLAFDLLAVFGAAYTIHKRNQMLNSGNIDREN